MLPFFLGEPQELPDPALPTEFAKHVAQSEEPWLELAQRPSAIGVATVFGISPSGVVSSPCAAGQR